jgi:Flp pilus assembly protein TadG
MEVRAMKKMRRRNQAGAAALEFALVLPSFMLLVGMMISLCTAMYSRYLLAYVAETAARTCVMQSLPTDGSVQVKGCAEDTARKLLQTIKTGCTNQPNPVAAANIMSAGPSPALYLLTVSLSCQYNVLPIVSAASHGSTITTIELSAQGAMPFLN